VHVGVCGLAVAVPLLCAPRACVCASRPVCFNLKNCVHCRASTERVALLHLVFFGSQQAVLSALA